MAAPSKTRTSIWSGTVLASGAANTNGAWIDLSTSYGAQLSIQLTNGGTGPTIAAQVQVQTANNYNAGSPTLPVSYGGALVGSVTSGVVSQWSVEIPIGVEAVRLVAGSNTGQSVTVDADVSSVTGVA